ncbi:MAG TPA: MarR family transcriptional regulator [Tepidiformaceae bacterium]|nr:MarR family transcriptional regulator [Tepidiformaceae bacterium]HMO94672.1 MarR family transcriptional regulator [Tepidiformaceae bacterium]
MTRARRTRHEEAIDALFASSALLDPARLMVWDRENLTVTQLRLLWHLREQEGLSNAELAERLFVTRPSVSALLERLERGGFIRREVSPNDRRSICIWMEPRGRAALENLRGDLRDYARGLMEDLTEAEIEAFTTAVQRFVEVGRAKRMRDLATDAPTP